MLIVSDIPSADLDNNYKDPYQMEQNDPESDSDSIDEVSLKDVEVDLTDDQKAERQIIAEDLKARGNEAFKDGEYERSIEKYTEGKYFKYYKPKIFSINWGNEKGAYRFA